MNPEVAVPLFVVGGLVAILFAWRAVIRIRHRRRSKLALQMDDQRELERTNPVNAILKKHVLYAPLFGARHSREFRFLRLHMGSIPLRLEMILLLVYLALNLIFVVVTVDWWEDFSKKMFQLKYAAGHLAVMNTPGLVLSAGRNNLLVPLLGLSFDTFNFMHRWVGRVIAVNAVVHMGAVLANQAYLSTFGVECTRSQLLTIRQTARVISCTLSGRCPSTFSALSYVAQHESIHLQPF